MGLFDIFKRQKKAYHHVIDVSDADFEVQVMQRSFKKPLLVDFWAAWCVPCRQLGPVLERIAIEPESKVYLAKLNTEHNQKTAQSFSIQSIPAVKMIRNGSVVGQFVGLQMEHNIRRFIDEKTALDAPRVRMRMPKDSKKRLQQAKQYLEKGDGFRAVMLLNSLSDQAEAETLLPLAQFFWDVNDGDALTGDAKVDELLIDALESAENGNLASAKALLTEAQSAQPDLVTALQSFDHLKLK